MARPGGRRRALGCRHKPLHVLSVQHMDILVAVGHRAATKYDEVPPGTAGSNMGAARQRRGAQCFWCGPCHGLKVQHIEGVAQTAGDILSPKDEQAAANKGGRVAAKLWRRVARWREEGPGHGMCLQHVDGEICRDVFGLCKAANGQKAAAPWDQGMSSTRWKGGLWRWRVVWAGRWRWPWCLLPSRVDCWNPLQLFQAQNPHIPQIAATKVASDNKNLSLQKCRSVLIPWGRLLGARNIGQNPAVLLSD
mmetsp:Transcript_131/g.471  ORF Transcript_131/g.471 Transcript_131/m.471 type:complete len:250 (-) Transcript_131:695-1444(-)